MFQNKLAKHFWKESLPKIIATAGILVVSVMKSKKALLQNSTVDKSEGALLQNKLAKNFWKDPLLLVAGLVDLVWGVSWFGASPLAQGLLCQSQNGALIECGFPQLLWRLPAIPSRPREGAVAPKQACKAFPEGELA